MKLVKYRDLILFDCFTMFVDRGPVSYDRTRGFGWWVHPAAASGGGGIVVVRVSYLPVGYPS